MYNMMPHFNYMGVRPPTATHVKFGDCESGRSMVVINLHVAGRLVSFKPIKCDGPPDPMDVKSRSTTPKL